MSAHTTTVAGYHLTLIEAILGRPDSRRRPRAAV